MPLSITVNRSMHSFNSRVSVSTLTETSLCSVNLVAFPTRLITTCRSLVASPQITAGTSSATSHNSSRPLLSALNATVFNIDSKASRRLKSVDSRSIFAASIFEKSRMSLITISSASEDHFAIPDTLFAPA